MKCLYSLGILLITIIFINACEAKVTIEPTPEAKAQMQEISQRFEQQQQQAEKGINKVKEEIKERAEEIEGKKLPVKTEEIKKEEIVSKEDLLKNSKAKNTQNSITLSLDDYNIEVKGEDFAKITKIKFTVINEGITNIYPSAKIYLYNQDEEDLRQKAAVKQTINMEGWIDDGNYKTIDAPVNIAFNEINKTKFLRLGLYEGFGGKYLVDVETNFKVK